MGSEHADAEVRTSEDARGARKDEKKTVDPHVGLCLMRRQAQRVRSAKGGIFVLCSLSRIDPRFPRYPGLPVMACPGFQKSLEDSGQ